MAAFPIIQDLASPTTLITPKGGIRSDVGSIVTTYSTTGIADLNPYISSYAGAMIVTSADILYYRNQAANAWIQILTATGGVPISSLTAAVATNTISNAAFAQTWDWNTLNSGYGLRLLTTSTAASGGSQILFAAESSGANSSSGQSTYSAFFSNTHGGTTSTNIAAYFIASGGTTANYAAQFARGKVSIGTTGLESGVLEILGSASGVITIQPQAAAGTWNWNWPTSAGTAGQILTSQGGGGTAMTWQTGVPLSSLTAAVATNTINSGNFAQEWQWNTLSGANALKLTSTSTASNGILLYITTSGAYSAASSVSYGAFISNTHTGTTSQNIGLIVGASGATQNIGIIANGGTTGRGNNGAAIVAEGAIEIDGTINGRLLFRNSTSGYLTMVSAATGTWTLTLPTTDGNSGEFLQTNGSGVTTWAAASGSSSRFGVSGEDATASQLRSFSVGTDYSLTLTGDTSDEDHQAILIVTQSNNDGSAIRASSLNSPAIIGVATSGYGVVAQSSAGAAVFATSSSGIAFQGGSSSAAGFSISGGAASTLSVSSASTSSVVAALHLTREITGTPGNGAGISIELKVETSLVGSVTANQLISKWTDIATATRTSQFIITGVNNATTADLFTLSGSGALRLNTYGAGTATFDASGNITSVSDERLKNISGNYTAGLNEVMKINPILYKWNEKSNLDTENEYAGFSAQNIEEVLGAVATGTNGEGYKSIQDRAILGMLTNAVKEQQATINDLKEQIKNLKN